MSKIILDKEAYFHNLTQIAEKVGCKNQIWLILKDNAYGHGAVEIAQMAREFGIKRAVVNCEREAREIAPFFEEVLILSHIANGGEDERFIYAINSLKDARLLKRGSKAHIACDSGMRRNGVMLDELEQVAALAAEREIKLCGAFTHFKDAENLNGGEFNAQVEAFAAFKRRLGELGVVNLAFHSCNSAGVERTQNFGIECVRVGIAQFGYSQCASLQLRPVLSVWAEQISSRELKKGETMGYGGRFKASSDMRVATYDLGYGDGLLRYGGEGVLKLARGEQILGKMSMNSFCAKDLGEWVCVFEDARAWAKFFGTIEYEILVKLSPFIKREIR